MEVLPQRACLCFMVGHLHWKESLLIYFFLVDGIQVLEALALEHLLRSDFSSQQELVANLPQQTPLIEGANESCRISDSDGTRERIDGENSYYIIWEQWLVLKERLFMVFCRLTEIHLELLQGKEPT